MLKKNGFYFRSFSAIRRRRVEIVERSRGDKRLGDSRRVFGHVRGGEPRGLVVHQVYRGIHRQHGMDKRIVLV